MSEAQRREVITVQADDIEQGPDYASKPKLNDEQRTYVVQQLAMWEPVPAIQAALIDQWGIEVGELSIRHYDPTGYGGRRLGERWIELFHITREHFVKNLAEIGISHKATRLRALERMSRRLEANSPELAAAMHAQAAKEMGGAFTNARIVSTPDGRAPVQIQTGMDVKTAEEAFKQMLLEG